MPCINAVSFREFPSIESICRIVLNAGFDTLELSRPHFYEKLTTARTRRRFADWAGELGLGLYGFDCWVDVEPYTALDETVAEFRKAIDWAADLNLGMLISHDPWQHVNGDHSPVVCLQRNVEMFQYVAELCENKQLQLVFEPHPDTLSMQNSWAIDFVDAISSGRSSGTVGILYDCCHYGVGQPETYVQSIAELGKWIRHVHFSDGDRQTYAQHLAPGDGDLELESIVQALCAIGYDGTITSDVFNNPLLEDCAQRSAPYICDVENRLARTK